MKDKIIEIFEEIKKEDNKDKIIELIHKLYKLRKEDESFDKLLLNLNGYDEELTKMLKIIYSDLEIYN